MNRIKNLMAALLCGCLLLTAPTLSSCSDDPETEVTPPGGEEPGGEEPGGEEPGGEEPGGSDFRDEPDDTAADPTGIFDYSSLKGLGHPRLLMSAEDFEQLRVKVGSDRFSNRALYKVHSMVVNLADEYIDSNEAITYTFDSAGKRILGMSRLALQRIFACSYAYRMTGREKYLLKVEEDLQTVCRFPNWNASNHFLDVGEMALAVAIGYDWLYYELSYETRLLAHRSLINFAFTPSKGHWFRDRENNWNQVCYGGLVCAAVVLYEKDKAVCAQLIEDAVRDNSIVMRAIYAPDGNYPEGYMYWGYGTSYEVMLIAALEKAFGSSGGLAETEGFDRTGQYMLFMAGTTDRTFPYSDCSLNEYAKYAMWWFAARDNDASLLVNELRLFDNDKYTDSEEVRLLPMVPCLARNIPGLDDVSATAPSKKIWWGNGETPVVLIHTDWTFGESDKYVGIKGGYAASSHGHMDAGSFVYDAYGVRWSEDLGMQSYAALETALENAGGYFWGMEQNSMRWQVYRLHNKAHSTLTVNDSDHRVYGVASIDNIIEGAGELGARMKMTDVLADQLSSAYRTVKLVNETDLYIIDELTARSGVDAHVQWRMMTGTGVSTAADHIALSSGGKTMYLSATSSNSATIGYTTWAASGGRSWDAANTGMTVAGYTVTIPAGTSATLTTKLSITR